MKTIDLAPVIISGIDCEFWELDYDRKAYGPLIGFQVMGAYPYLSEWDSFRFCRIRQNHYHGWYGGECPLPEGLDATLFYRDRCRYSNRVENGQDYTGFDWRYDECCRCEIIGFIVHGTADGYRYEWEEEE